MRTRQIHEISVGAASGCLPVMVETAGLSRPLLVVVGGRPGSGKTSLAHALARAIRCPAICRDEIKEGYVNTTGCAGDDGDNVGLKIYEVFFDTLQFLLHRNISLVAEAAFQHKLWAPKLQPLLELARVRVVQCSVDAEIARARHIERGLADPLRERFHDDRPVRAAREGRQLPIGVFDPLRLDVPSLTVNTSDGYRPAFESIVAFASAQG